MNRDQATTHLVTNCACWKGKKDMLNNKQLFTDEEVVTLATNHQSAVLLTNSLRNISEAVGAPKTLTLNELPAFIEEKMEEKDGEKKPGEEEVVNAETCEKCGGEMIDGKCKCSEAAPPPAMNRRARSTEEWINQAPPEARAMLNGLIANERSAKNELITKLVGNAAAPVAAQLRKAYARNTVDELKAMVSAMGVTNRQRNDDNDPLTLYFGAGGGGDNDIQVDNAAADQGVEYSGAWPAAS